MSTVHTSALAGLAVLAIAFGSVTQAAPLTPLQLTQARKVLDKGNELLQKGDLSGAKTEFEKALEIIPYLPDAHTGLGHIAMKQRRFGEALGSYEAARNGYETMSKEKQRIEMERYLANQRQASELKDQLNNLKAGTGSGATKVGEATVNLKDQQVTAATDKVRREDHPSGDPDAVVPAEAHFLVGTALFQLQRYDDAVTAWEQTVATKPDFAPVYNNLALAYWKTGKFDKAQASLAKAEELGLKVNPQFKADLARAAERATATAAAPN